MLLKDRGDVSLHRCPRCGFVSGRPLRDETPAERYHNYYAGPAPPAPAFRYHEWLRYAESLVYFTRRTLGAALQAAGYSGARLRWRSIDVFAWRRPGAGERAVAFDAKEAVHAGLGVTGLGDTLLAWARK